MSMPNPFDVRFDGDDPRDLRFHAADPARAVILTASQVDEFNDRGFLAPVQVFNDSGILEIRAYLDDLIATVLSAEDRRNGYSIVACHLVCRGLYELLRTPAVVERVADLVGPDVVGWSSQVFCKGARRPHGGAAAPGRDLLPVHPVENSVGVDRA
jgi:hypothetical protein